MRKILSVITAAALLFAISCPAFAAENASTLTQDGYQSIDVTAHAITSSGTVDCYSVDIRWSDMSFTFESNTTKLWNAGDHSYFESITAGWDKTEASITVINHSNIDVDVTVTYTPAEGTGIAGTVSNGMGTLAAGEVGKYDSADSMTAVLTISGTPTAAVTSNGVKIGSITVTVQ